MIVTATARCSEFTEPRIRFKTTQNAHGSTATAALWFLTSVSQEAAVKQELTGDQTRPALILEALTRSTHRLHTIIQEFESSAGSTPKSNAGSSIMSKLVDRLRHYLEVRLRLVDKSAQVPNQANATHLPVLRSQEFVDRLNLSECRRDMLRKKLDDWPLKRFWRWARKCILDFGKTNIEYRNSRCLASSEDNASILFKRPDDAYLKGFLKSSKWCPPESKLRDFEMFKDCVVNRNWDNIREFQEEWNNKYHQVSVNTLTVTLSRLYKKGPPLHHCNVSLPMVHPCVLGFSKRDDWDKLLLLIAKLWQDELTKSDEFLSFERDHGVISWDVVHHKRTILNVDGNPFVLARCNSDRMAVVARWKEESTGAQKDLVHMYFAIHGVAASAFQTIHCPGGLQRAIRCLSSGGSHSHVVVRDSGARVNRGRTGKSGLAQAVGITCAEGWARRWLGSLAGEMATDIRCFGEVERGIGDHRADVVRCAEPLTGAMDFVGLTSWCLG